MDYHLLNLGPATSHIRSILITEWGTQVRAECIYDPFGVQRDYQLIFTGCSKVELESQPFADYRQDFADLLGISLGQSEGQQPAVLNTDKFEMLVTYNRFECLKDW
jgi:hypothetical protein